MYNFDDQEEEEEAPPKEKLEENEQLKEKMKQLRGKMEKLTLTKKVCGKLLAKLPVDSIILSVCVKSFDSDLPWKNFFSNKFQLR